MLIPATRYADCETALAFLRDGLGLTEHLVYRDDAGAILHVEMRLGDGIFMFGPDTVQGDFSRFVIEPRDTGGRATVTLYAVMADVAACHDRVRAAGGDIVMPVTAQAHGGHSFSFRDPGDHVWTVGDYNPLA